MPEAIRTMRTTQALREKPQYNPFTPIFGDSEEEFLEVVKGEKVSIGKKPDVKEQTTGGQAFTWVFVEATGGTAVDKRKGYVPDTVLAPEDAAIGMPDGFEPFQEQVDKEEFANTCYVQAMLNETNPAYLYALAFALSGDQWSATDVKTNDPRDAPAFGVFRFPKETWQSLLSEPEATGISPDDIKFPDVQCIVAAIVAAKSANLLKSLIMGRDLNAVDLFLAHLFADDKSFGSNATTKILQAAKENKTQPSKDVIKTIYPNSSVQTSFFKRNKDVFNQNGSASIGQALDNCATKLDLGFDEVRKLADKIEADVFSNSIPSKSTRPIPGGRGGEGRTGNGAGGSASGATGGSVTGINNGIDRRQFLEELKNPAIVKKSADMVKGEVGWSAPHNTKVVQLETVFNRAMARGHSLAQALWSKSEDRIRGYYQGGRSGTYSRPVTTAEFDNFKKDILTQVLAGSNKSEELLGFIATGNASPPTSTEQYRSGTLGGALQTGVFNHPESYFHEGPFWYPFKRFQGGESVPLPYELSSSVPTASSGEPPERMEGDIEGHGLPGGKFNVRSGTPIAPQREHKTITLSNGQKVQVNRTVAEQFRGFFNDLIKLGAPVRSLGGFGVRPNNPSQHPIGFAVDWAQHSRNVVDYDVRNWIDHNRPTLKKLELRWGLSGGENWGNPDTGHFSVERILGEQHLRESRKASERA